MTTLPGQAQESFHNSQEYISTELMYAIKRNNNDTSIWVTFVSKLWLQRCAVCKRTVQAAEAELCQAQNKLKLFNLVSLRTDITTEMEERGGTPQTKI